MSAVVVACNGLPEPLKCEEKFDERPDACPVCRSRARRETVPEPERRAT